ncbi:PREDICTED: geranylgeranyl transferase type-2 subunit alpha [Ceratosolen solmsi marchali]|uniref:Geranylgeranyl transferase type-2 subunit alpha n=1 Tax=Ceratosolen solmsi marchali TaxID=326594 RepID=A0AAJ6YC91_9HYME|nr:PREDICTED: geranylgeranyl transferase type-2 subunit alpha [Ceratosolen solmsi marchali]
MHGRVKVRTTEQQEKIKQLEKQRIAFEFKKEITLVFEKRKNHKWDNELLIITQKLLIKQPDINTLWNIRREAFLNNNWSSNEWKQKLENELFLTEISLKENPKSYCVWFHRTWVIHQLSDPDWKKELKLCNKCLDVDERNFHCWDYRQFIVKKSNLSNEEELQFTTFKILNNFSNYSSWHYRSKLLQKLYPNCGYNSPISDNKLIEELDLVMNATFTDPDDSSSWFYQRWLLDYNKSSIKLWRAILTQTTITVAFHEEVLLNLELFFNNKKIDCKWQSANGKKFSAVWYAIFEKPLSTLHNKVCLKFEENIYKFKQSNLFEWIYKCEILNSNCNNRKLHDQIHNYLMLSKMEPSNKWAKLTSVYFLIIISNMQLTTIYLQKPYLTFYNEIDFSNNSLGYQLYQLYILQECIKLDLSNNNISSLKAFPTLHNLKILLLSENKITNLEEVLDLIRRHSLKQLDLKANPLLNFSLLTKEIKKSSLYLEIIF